MAKWLIEEGIGETRAALIAGGTIVEAVIELPGTLRAGTVAAGRLVDIIVPGRVGLVEIAAGEVLLQPLPRDLTQGARLVVEIIREAIGHKRPTARVAKPDMAERDGPDLVTRLRSTGAQVRTMGAHEADALEAAGWSELLEEADTGAIPFAGGGLLMSLTPAMTLLDVDGTLGLDALAVVGAGASGRAIRRLGIGGSIGIDLPTVADKSVRQAAATALDAALPQPFERTAVNGFGFLQVVRPQRRASLPQMLAADPTGAAARALLRRAERDGRGSRTLVAHPRVIERLEAEPDWIAALFHRRGAAVGLRAKPGLAISSGYAEP